MVIKIHIKIKKDVIYILRYMALYHHSSEYKKPIKDFLFTIYEKTSTCT